MVRWISGRSLTGLLVIACIALAGSEAGYAQAELSAFEFGLIGDFPYSPHDDEGMPHLLRDIREDESLRFVIHVGDLHNPDYSECSESFFRSRLEMLETLGHPFVLTPGDNDWADCDDEPMRQLESLRRVFFANPLRTNGPGGFSVRSQAGSEGFPEVVENAIWEAGGVVFATLHMIMPKYLSPPWPFEDETEGYRERLAAAGTAWLDEAFALAQAREARGVFLATQVSLWPLSGNPLMIEMVSPEFAHVAPIFADFEARLAERVLEFRRPVVLANGDTHFFRVDKPLRDPDGETLETFTRVEGFGTPHGHWVRIRVEPERPEVFSFQQELVEENLFTLTPVEQRRESYAPQRVGGIKLIVGLIRGLGTVLSWIGGIAIVLWIVKRVRRRRV